MGMVQNCIHRNLRVYDVLYIITYIYIYIVNASLGLQFDPCPLEMLRLKLSRDGHSTSFQFQGKFSRDIAEKTSTILPKTSWPWAAARNFVAACGAHAAFA